VEVTLSQNPIKTIALLLWMSFLPLSAETIHDFLVRGEQSFQEKDYKGALSQFKAAIELNKNSTRAHLGFAKTSLLVDSLADAKTSFEKVLDAEPKNKEAIGGLAEVLSRQGKHREGLGKIEKALQDEPYNTTLLLQRPRILLRMGNKETALKRLLDAKKKIDQNYDYNVLLVQAYIANKRFKEALQIVNQLINNNPENPESFLEKAKLNYELASRETNPEKIQEYMEEARELLHTAISLNPNYEESKKLLIKNSLWLNNHSEALKICEDILSEDPDDAGTLYYKAYILAKLGETEQAARDFGKLLKLRETEVLARYSAEEFSIQKLDERHALRVNLGRFRLDQFQKTKEDLLYQDANFHILRASSLIPEHRLLRKELADHYYRLGDRKRLIRLLLQMREDDPDDIRINNRLENVLKRLRTSLAYKEGYLTKDASIESGIRSEPEMYIFDLQPRDFFPEFPDLSHIITSVLKYSLSFHPKIKLVSPEEEEQIRAVFQNQSGKSNYTESIYYRPELAAKLIELRKKQNSIRFIGYGSIEPDKENLTINFHIYDKKLGKVIKNIRLSSFGRNRLTDLGVRLADQIIEEIPIEGKVVKVKKNTIIANIGFRDGLKKLDTILVEREGKAFEGKVLVLDEYFCEIGLVGDDWKAHLGTGYLVTKKNLPKGKK
jgi:tetratricopeptide (TPR) repeat protein